MPDTTAPSRFARAPAAPDPLDAEISGALELAAEFFRTRRTRAGLVARRLLGRPLPTDADLADHLIRERRRRSRLDGSIDGSLVATARAAWELLDLGAPVDHAGVVRLTGYLLSQQDAPGRWGEASARGTGFFSPGPIDQPTAPLALTTGVVLSDEEAARFAASCIALRSVLRAGMDERAAVRAHLDTLLDLTDQEPALRFVVVATVGLAGPDYRPRVEQLADAVAADQGADGTWKGVPLFHAVEALSTITTRAALRAIRRAAPAVLRLQRPTGAFDDAGDEDLAVLGVRGLVTARSALR